MFKVIGKNIDQSGLDETLTDANIYGPNTVEHIKAGKHYTRSFNAFLMLYVSLFQMYTLEILLGKIITKIMIEEAVMNIPERKLVNCLQNLSET